MGRRMKRWEAEVVRESVGRLRPYLQRLFSRMCSRGFDRDDDTVAGYSSRGPPC